MSAETLAALKAAMKKAIGLIEQGPPHERLTDAQVVLMDALRLAAHEQEQQPTPAEWKRIQKQVQELSVKAQDAQRCDGSGWLCDHADLFRHANKPAETPPEARERVRREFSNCKECPGCPACCSECGGTGVCEDVVDGAVIESLCHCKGGAK